MYECSPHAGQYRRYTDAQVAAFEAFKANASNPGDPYGTVPLSDPRYAGTFVHAGVAYPKSVFYGNGVYGPNKWQMYKMPIKASYCDAFHTACQHDYFCGSGDFWACKADYKAEELKRAAAAEAKALTAALAAFPAGIVAAVLNISDVTSQTAAALAQDLLAKENALAAQRAASSQRLAAANQAKDAAMSKAKQDKDAAMKKAKKEKEKDVAKAKGQLPTWAVALIIVLAVVFALICSVTCVIVQREKSGNPVFTAMDPTIKTDTKTTPPSATALSST
jgi:acyl-CoA synthetase (AMP-forming)/AMP-acid ligase II